MTGFLRLVVAHRVFDNRLAPTIDPALRTDSNLTDVRHPPYELFDAWFHWRD